MTHPFRILALACLALVVLDVRTFADTGDASAPLTEPQRAHWSRWLVPAAG